MWKFLPTFRLLVFAFALISLISCTSLKRKRSSSPEISGSVKRARNSEETVVPEAAPPVVAVTEEAVNEELVVAEEAMPVHDSRKRKREPSPTFEDILKILRTDEDESEYDDEDDEESEDEEESVSEETMSVDEDLKVVATTDGANSGNTKKLTSLDDYLLAIIASFDFEVQATLRTVCRNLKNVVDNLHPYQHQLGLNFGLPGLSALPFHRDLILFRGFHFAEEAKVDALIFLYRQVRVGFIKSGICQAVLALVFDEAARLAQCDQEAFERFERIGRFSIAEYADQLFVHFVEKDNVAGYVALKRASRRERSRVSTAVEQTKYIKTLAAYLKEHPMDFWCLFDYQLSPFTLLTFFSTGLPQEAIMKDIDRWLERLNFIDAFELLWDTFTFNFAELPLHQNNYLRLIQSTAISAIRIHNQRFETGCDCGKLFRSFGLLGACRFGQRTADRVKAILENNSNRFHVETVRSRASLAFMYGNRFDDALEFLPEAFSKRFSDAVLSNEQFCAVVAQKKPEWIRVFYAAHQSFLYTNREMLFAFFGISSVNEFFEFATQGQILRIAKLIHTKGSMEEVQDLINHIQAQTSASRDQIGEAQARLMQQHFGQFLRLEMPDDRFMAILALFLQWKRSVRWHTVTLPWTTMKLSAQKFMLIFGPDSPVRHEMTQMPFGFWFDPAHDVIIEILNCPLQGAKLVASEEFFSLHFGSAIHRQTSELRSPLGLMRGWKIEPASPLVSVLRIMKKFIRKFYMVEMYCAFDNILIAFNFIKTLDECNDYYIRDFLQSGNVVDVLANFEAEMPPNMHPESFEVLKRIYASASPSQKNLMLVALNQAERFKQEFLALDPEDFEQIEDDESDEEEFQPIDESGEDLQFITE